MTIRIKSTGLEKRLTYESPILFAAPPDDLTPLNPRGRTGLAGRGCFDYWGPNHVCEPIITRFHPSGETEGERNARVADNRLRSFLGRGSIREDLLEGTKRPSIATAALAAARQELANSPAASSQPNPPSYRVESWRPRTGKWEGSSPSREHSTSPSRENSTAASERQSTGGSSAPLAAGDEGIAGLVGLKPSTNNDSVHTIDEMEIRTPEGAELQVLAFRDVDELDGSGNLSRAVLL